MNVTNRIKQSHINKRNIIYKGSGTFTSWTDEYTKTVLINSCNHEHIFTASTTNNMGDNVDDNVRFTARSLVDLQIIPSTQK